MSTMKYYSFGNYLGKSLNDIDQDFSHHLEELENTACLSLLAAAEAILRMEYLKRVYKRGKDPLSRDFRELYKKKKTKHILKKIF